MKIFSPIALLLALYGCSGGEGGNATPTPAARVTAPPGLAGAPTSTPGSSLPVRASAVAVSAVEFRPITSPVSGGAAISGVAAASSSGPAASAVSVVSTRHNEYPEATEVKTRYGMVQYRAYSDEITVDGTHASGGDGAYDVLNNLGQFQLNNEDVILFEAGNTGSVGVPDDLFFLVLKPNVAPRVVGTPLNPQINEVKRAWREGDAVLVDFTVGDYDEFTSPLKFENDKVVITKAIPALYQKGGPKLTDGDCHNLYDIAAESCATTFTERNQECSDNAVAGSVFRGRSDLTFFRYISDLPGYSEKNFNRICVSWCKGKGIEYTEFSKLVCHIK